MSSTELLNFLIDIYRDNNMTLNTLRTPSNNTTSMENTRQVSECLMDINCYIVNSAVRLLHEQMFPTQFDSSPNNLTRIPTRPTQTRTQPVSISQSILQREPTTQNSTLNNTSNTTSNSNISSSNYNRNYARSNPYYLYDIISEYTIPLRQPTTNTSNITDPLITTLLRSFMDPVPSRNEGLTEEEILRATRICNYGNIVGPSNTSCPISLDVFDDNTSVCMIRGCYHIFKQEPLYSWLRSNNRCPVCRYDVKLSVYRHNNQTINESNNQQQNESLDDDEERSETDSIS